MANKFPYISSSGSINSAITQFRKSFPGIVDSDTLKKLSLAPNNESYLINIIRFLGLIDGENKKTTTATKIFTQHDDEVFAKGFAEVVAASYKELLDLRGNDAWTLDQNSLIAFFRQSDQSTAIVGQRQANTFQTLAVVSGKRTAASNNSAPKQKSGTSVKPAISKPKKSATTAKISDGVQDVVPKQEGNNGGRSGAVGLTVRIEINLPAQGDQDTYDRIFKSIRENFLSGK